MFSGKSQIPCVGISFGVDRIFSITKAHMETDKAVSAVRLNEVDVYVMALGFSKTFTGLLKERMEICRTLWDAGIKVCGTSAREFWGRRCCCACTGDADSFSQAEFAYKQKPKLPAQFKLADAGGVPFAVILGEDEQAQGKIRIKEMGLVEGHPEKDGVLVDVVNLVSEVKRRLAAKADEGMDVDGEVGEVAGTAEKLDIAAT